MLIFISSVIYESQLKDNLNVVRLKGQYETILFSLRTEHILKQTVEIELSQQMRRAD